MSSSSRHALRLAPTVAALVCSILLGLSSCSETLSDARPPEPSRCAFERDVYPVLNRDCGFVACHGNPARFFQVYGPGRTRLDPATDIYAPPTTAEIERSYARARSMLAVAADGELPELLRKPLEGSGHQGLDAFSRNVYRDDSDPRWAALRAWVDEESPPCP
ncbi:MAG: hypothetical protein ACPGUV_12870 [Polyangiales bacterium]